MAIRCVNLYKGIHKMTEYKLISDTELFGLLKGGDHAAFTHVYKTYWDKLYYISLKKLQDEAEAEEAVQDIFMKLWDNRAKFQLKASLESYLVSAVHYQIIDRRQKAIRREVIEQKIGMTTDEEIKLGLLPDLSQEYFEKLQAKVNRVVLTLPAKCQLVFRMSRDEDYTNKRIAEELGISEKAVEKHVTHAMKVLKKDLGSSALLILISHCLLK